MNEYNIDVYKEFYKTTGYSANDYAALIFLAWCYFTKTSFTSTLTNEIIQSENPLFKIENVKDMVEKYSITVEEIKNSQIKRQCLYSKPFIKIENEYVAANPFLILSLFSNCLY